MIGEDYANVATTCNFKVVLLGEGCVGKTSLVLRYIDDKFNDTHQSTLQASFVNKRLNLAGRRVSLSIWDTAGQEKFHALGPIYYRNAHGAVLVYDVTDADSFAKVRHWVKELRAVLGANVLLTIAANKIDLVDQQPDHRNVPLDTAEQYAISVGATHLQTSAKLNINVERLFVELTMRMLEREPLSSSGETVTSSSGLLRLAADDESENAAETASRTRCCATH